LPVQIVPRYAEQIADVYGQRSTRSIIGNNRKFFLPLQATGTFRSVIREGIKEWRLAAEYRSGVPSQSEKLTPVPKSRSLAAARDDAGWGAI